MKRDDKTLLAAVSEGDRCAFEVIYRAHKDALFHVALSVLGGDWAGAEDVLHDVFVSLAKRAGEFELTGTLRNYLAKSCLNRSRDMLRHRSRECVSDELTGEGAFEWHDPSSILQQTEQSRELMVVLARLSREQREIVLLHIYGELKFREIAELLSISINTAQSRYRYALTAMRKSLTASEAAKDERS